MRLLGHHLQEPGVVQLKCRALFQLALIEQGFLAGNLRHLQGVLEKAQGIHPGLVAAAHGLPDIGLQTIFQSHRNTPLRIAGSGLIIRGAGLGRQRRSAGPDTPA
jgi:hypothetical protein